MSATYKKEHGLGAHRVLAWSACLWLVVLACCWPGAMPAHAAEASVPEPPIVGAGERSNRVAAAYLDWRSRFLENETNSETAWQFSRACFARADFATNNAQRAAIAEQGIAASRRAIRLQTNSAAGYFYLGVNLGQLARTKLFTALGLLDEMEEAWKRSIAIEPKFHFAAAHRSLGLLYLEAPGWPLSLGSRSKARRELQKAIELVPGYPENQICWLEARLRWGETRAVQTQLAAVEALLASARANFSGAGWAQDWQDWNARWNSIRSRAEKAALARSPRDSR